MATLANLLVRSLLRMVVVAVSLIIGMAATSQKSFASCGDYLHHGPMPADHSSASGSGKMAQGAPIFFWHNLLEQTRGQRGTTRCERGQCHQAPPAAPAESPRTIPVRDQSFVCKLIEQNDAQESASWPRPVSGALLATPFRELLSPPPESC